MQRIGNINTKKIKEAALLASLQYSQSFVSIVISIWLVKYISQSDYGIYSYGLVCAAILSTIVNFGSDRTLVRDLNHSDRPESVMTASLLLRTVLVVVVSGLFLGWVSYTKIQTNYYPEIVILGFSGLLLGFTSKAWYDSKYKMSLHALIRFCEKVCYAIAMIFYFILQPNSINVLYVACLFLLVRGFFMFIESVVVLRMFSPNLKNLTVDLPKLISGGYLTYFATLSSTVTPYVNQLILGEKVGATALAQYFIAFQVIAAVQLIQQVFARILTPKIASITKPPVDLAVVKKLLKRYMKVVLFSNVSLLVPILLLAPVLFDVLLPDTYVNSLTIFSILCISVLFFGINLILSQFLICLRFDSAYLQFTLARGVMSGLIALLVIPHYGAIGVAITVLLVRVISTLIQILLVMKAFNSVKKAVPAT